MQASRAQPQTVAYYRVIMGEFEQWAAEQGLKLDTVDRLDQALTAHMDSLFFEGYNHDRGEKLVAAVKYFDADGSRQSVDALPRARAALRGSASAPPASRERLCRAPALRPW